MPNHPNTTAAAVAGGLTTLLVWALAKWGVHLSVDETSFLVTGATAIVLYIGKAGLKAGLLRIWGGVSTVWAGTPAPTAKP